MKIIGQGAIAPRIAFLLSYFYTHNEGENFLLRGPSGFGKTRLALQMANYLTDNTGKFIYAVLDKENPEQYLYTGYRVFVFDEIHAYKGEIEYLYPYMDARKNILIFCSNDTGHLKEAFLNRCVTFNFAPYTIGNLIEIAKTALKFALSDDDIVKIVSASGNNPRILKDNYIRQLNILHKERPELFEDFDGILQNIFSIGENLLDDSCTRYLDILESLGGTSSLGRISSIMHIDTQTIERDIEPILLDKRLITIGRGGRKIV